MFALQPKKKYAGNSTCIFVCVLSVLLQIQAGGQNYVLNPSFERITSCPDDFFQIYKASPWFSPYCETSLVRAHGNAVLFSSSIPCSNQLAAVPQNVWCTQDAHSGLSYAGVIVISSKQLYTEFRHYLETKLTQPLQAGSKYYFSMFYCLPPGDYYHPSLKDICYNSNGTGVYFSEDSVNNSPACQPLTLLPHISAGNAQISPANKWYELAGCYTAKGNEQFLTIGNFANNLASGCSGLDTTGYYLMIDDVTLIASVSKKIDTLICSGKNWTVNAQLLREEYSYLNGWQYKWIDGDTSRKRKFAESGIYTLHISNKDCFEDVYQFNIAVDDCNCKNYTANAFTPNGDNINDLFLPKITCQSGPVSGYRFSVFNRWGQKLYFTTSVAEAWNGKYLGEKVAAGSYIYLVEYKTGASAATQIIKGSVLVLDQ